MMAKMFTNATESLKREGLGGYVDLLDKDRWT